MDLVLVGLPGSGKSAVGRRIAARHGATFVDLDEQIEHAAGRTIPEIFASDGEAAFRRLEREAVAALGPPDGDRALRRVISPGGGAIVDPRNRWTLYRGRLPSGSTSARRSSASGSAARPTSGRSSRAATPWAASARWRPLASASTRRRTGSTASPSCRA